MFNVRIYDYPNGPQLRIYEDVHGKEKDDTVSAKSHHCFVENPFTDKYEWFEVMPYVEPYDLEKKKEHSINSSLSRSINAIYNISRSNVWDWFFTFTFNPDSVDSYNYNDCVQCLSKWLNNVRRTCPDIRYLIVPEKHESGRFHFHGLFACCDNLGFVDSGKKTKKGQVIFNISKYKYGFTTATRIDDNAKATKYICKYINKDLISDSFNKKRYWVSRNVERVEPQDAVFTREEIEDLKKRCSDFILYSKKIGCGETGVTYIELSKEWGCLNEDFRNSSGS